MSSSSVPARPPFSALPLDTSGPPGNAWGLYRADDQLGALNMLTPEVVAASAAMQQSVDGFRHFGYQKAKRFYNNTPAESLTGDHLGINIWLDKGGIVGRGVLLDYASLCKRHALSIDPFSSTCIPMSHIHQMVEEQKLTLRTGDILLIRVGFTAAYDKLDINAQIALAQRPSPGFLGVGPSTAVLQWIWESGFAAVAGDAPSFEQAPVRGHWRSNTLQDHVKDGGMVHQVLLGGWSVPIGELFDLEKLSATCSRLQRRSFFISSMPLNVPGGVASPPDAVAIF
ncbi:cyclase protein [Ophiostoma piceae UAMH 11346]|uniref:Cyclase protein n=1 Tax=Ophiostoma piceae (strain UAMH 11346) TaxID=1262450 RepID=S3CE67_OPHP1|nr:cyclase protein [Ophiostoma piceae UAMH 11346]